MIIYRKFRTCCSGFIRSGQARANAFSVGGVMSPCPAIAFCLPCARLFRPVRTTDNDMSGKTRNSPKARSKKLKKKKWSFRTPGILFILTAIGMMLWLGQGLRLYRLSQMSEELKSTVDGLYFSVLENPGLSPFGRLQFELGKLKAQRTQEIDVIGLMAVLSRHAPQSLRVDRISLRQDDGDIAGFINTDAELNNYMMDLMADEQAGRFFSFRIDETNGEEQGVSFVLQVRFVRTELF